MIAFLVATAISGPRPVCAQVPSSQRGVAPITPGATSAPQHGAYYGLVIGINDYPNLPKLATAVDDARAVKEILQTRYGFDVNLLTNVSRDQIISALSGYRHELHDNDSLLIYYAGHGLFDREAAKGYWLPVDAAPDEPANWISADDITTSVRVLPVRHVLVVSDSCYAGTLTRSAGLAMRPLDPSRYVQKMLEGRSRHLMASGGNEPVADGGAPGHSIFANALLQGLSQMDQNPFTATDLFSTFIQRYVVGGSEQVPQYVPIPNSGDQEGDFVFIRRQIFAEEDQRTGTGGTSVASGQSSGSAISNREQEVGGGASSDDLAQAKKLSEAGSYASALPLFQRAALRGSAQAEASLHLGDYYNTAELRYTGVPKNDIEAVKWYRKAAEAGNATAMARLGSMYENGRGVQADYAQAMNWYRKAAEAGEAAGMSKLGSMYENGHGLETDYAQAVSWYRKAAEAGDTRGMNDLGRMYASGRGVEEDAWQAMRWWRKSAEAGDETGMRYLGRTYERGGPGVEMDPSQAAGWYQKAAEGGDPAAMVSLGGMYADGRGVGRDPTQAASWYGKAMDLYRKRAEAGDTAAMRDLGSLYLQGRGVQKDPAQAMNWERRAADAGDEAAMMLVGGSYSRGLGVEKDPAQAVKWYRKAADAGYSAAMLSLGRMYENGTEGIEKDYAQARNWYARAAEAGSVEGMFAMGRMYHTGAGVARDDVQAQTWYQKAAAKAESTGPGAMMSLGSLYERGTGAENDLGQAVNWYRKAAEAGYPAAMLKLGNMYESGTGVTQDYAQAVTWYSRAAQQGNALGMLALGIMYHNGNGVPQDEAQAVNWYRRAAVTGGPRIMMNLGSRYERGKNGWKQAGGVEQDYAQASSWYTKAAELGYAPAMMQLGSMYERGLGVQRDAAQAASWYRKAADAGDARAAARLETLSNSSLTSSSPPALSSPAVPNFAGTWVEVNPKDPTRPRRLLLQQNGGQVTFAGFQLTIGGEGVATGTGPQGCPPNFQKPGYNYDRPTVVVRLKMSLQGSNLVYEKESTRTAPCDGIAIGTQRGTSTFQRAAAFPTPVKSNLGSSGAARPRRPPSLHQE